MTECERRRWTRALNPCISRPVNGLVIPEPTSGRMAPETWRPHGSRRLRHRTAVHRWSFSGSACPISFSRRQASSAPARNLTGSLARGATGLATGRGARTTEDEESHCRPTRRPRTPSRQSCGSIPDLCYRQMADWLRLGGGAALVTPWMHRSADSVELRALALRRGRSV
jgi:hypothetical protein